jgi:hypothetical protein
MYGFCLGRGGGVVLRRKSLGASNDDFERIMSKEGSYYSTTSSCDRLGDRRYMTLSTALQRGCHSAGRVSHLGSMRCPSTRISNILMMSVVRSSLGRRGEGKSFWLRPKMTVIIGSVFAMLLLALCVVLLSLLLASGGHRHLVAYTARRRGLVVAGFSDPAHALWLLIEGSALPGECGRTSSRCGALGWLFTRGAGRSRAAM